MRLLRTFDVTRVKASSKLVEYIGLSIYILIFIFAIPYHLYYHAPYFFHYYILNVDILATIFTTIKEPNIFGGLYKSSPKSAIEILSIIIINLVVLTSLISFSIENNKKFGEQKAVIIGAITIVLTFMIPTYLIPFFENYAKPYITTLSDNRNVQVALEYVVGTSLGLGFILFEKFVIETFII